MGNDNLDNVTIVSVIAIVVAFLWSWIYISIQQRNNRLLHKKRWIDQLPALVSTLGVLGTFAGITIGLYFFDTDDLDHSIPKLLSGLKTAFYTSLAGMIGSLILSKIVNTAFDKDDGGVSDINQAAGKICKVISDLKEQLEQQSGKQVSYYNSMSELFYTMKGNTDVLPESRDILKEIENKLTSLLLISQNQIDTSSVVRDSLHSIQTSLGNVEENCQKQLEQQECINHNLGETLEVVSAISTGQEEISVEVKNFSELIRGEVDDIEMKMEDTNKLLTEKFDEFSVLLKKSNTEALVEVMKKVTEEFQKQMNALINKLIQENFDQLNKSVEKLNAWQQENKEMIASLTKQYYEMVSSFEQTSTVLESVSKDTQSLVGDGGRLRQIVDALSKVLVEDEKFIAVSTKLADTAELTKQNMIQFDNSTKSLNEWVRKQRHFVDGVQLLIEKLEDLNKIRNYNEQFWQGTKQSLEEGVGIITQGSQALNKQLTELDKQFYARLSTTLAELDTCIQAMIRGNNNRRLI